MPQILIRPERIKGDRFFLDGSEAHHVIRVLRKKAGDELDCFDGQGRKFRGLLTRIRADEDEIEGKILPGGTSREKPKVSIRLFQGLPKGSKFDYVIEKATELGAHEIFPFLSQKSVIRAADDRTDAKVSRWKRVATAAAEQCDRVDVPKIATVKKLQDLAEELKGFTIVFGVKAEGSLRVLIETFRKSQAANLNLIIGPESGFSEEELDWLTAHGARPVSLGQLTLRTETAGLAALTLVNYELGSI